MKLSYASFLAAGLALLTDQAAGDLATSRRLGSTSPEAATDEQLERALVEVEGMSMPIEVVDEEEAELEGDGAAVVPASGHTPYLCAYPPFSHLQWCQPQAYFHSIGTHGMMGHVAAHTAGYEVAANGAAGMYGTSDEIGLVTVKRLSDMMTTVMQANDFAMQSDFWALNASSDMACFGLTWRASMSPKSAFCSVVITQGHGIQMYYRPTYGAQTVNATAIGGIGASQIAAGDNVTLRLTMVGGQMTASYRFSSYDAWTAVPTTTCGVTMPYSNEGICAIAGSAALHNELATVNFGKVGVSTWKTHDIK